MVKLEHGARPKKGLIQSRRLGDIIIALPIAKYFADRGAEVYWPIDRRYLPHFSDTVSYVRFLPLEADARELYLYERALAPLQAAGCEDIRVLYSGLRGHDELIDPILASSMSFDRYKYAVAGVPFREKWRLAIKRDLSREQALFDRLVKEETYIVCQLESGDFKVRPKMQVPKGTQIIQIHEATDNLFDWLTILEKASMLVLIDSCFANLVEQLNIPTRKLFIRRSSLAMTPVLLNEWEFMR